MDLRLHLERARRAPGRENDAVAERLDHFDHRRHLRGLADGGPCDVGDRSSARLERDVLGSDSEDDLATRRGRQIGTFERQPQASGEEDPDFGIRRDLSVEEVHRRASDEAGHEAAGGCVVDLERRADLADDSAVHDHDPVSHRHRFYLVVRDVDHRRPNALVQAFQLRAHVNAQLRIQVGKRLVEEKHPRLTAESGADGDALALAARELTRFPLEVFGQTEDRRHLSNAPVEFRLRRPPQFEREGHVSIDRHVRVERIALEDHRDVAVARRQVRHGPTADADVACGHLLEAGDHSQRRRLTATGGADENQKLLIADRQIDAGDRTDVAEALLDSFQDDVGHWLVRGPSSLVLGRRGPDQGLWTKH